MKNALRFMVIGLRLAVSTPFFLIGLAVGELFRVTVVPFFAGTGLLVYRSSTDENKSN